MTPKPLCNDIALRRRVLMAIIRHGRRQKHSWVRISQDCNRQGVWVSGPMTAGGLRQWWSRIGAESTRAIARRRHALIRRISQIMHDDPFCTLNDVVEIVHRDGLPAPRGGRVSRELVARYMGPLAEQNGDMWRPRHRGECPETRPCPYVGCRYHLAISVTGRGHILPRRASGGAHSRVLEGDLDGFTETCALDVAETDWLPLEAVGEHMELSRERIRQVYEEAMAKVEKQAPEVGELLRRAYDYSRRMYRTRMEVEGARATDPRVHRDGTPYAT